MQAKYSPKWDDLQTFLEVCRQGSIHAAAKRLQLDHSTVCRRISRLEDGIGMKLLDRTQKGTIVRSEGQAFVQHLEQMDLHAHSVRDTVINGASHAAQVVRMATMEGIASRYLALRIPLLERFNPKIVVELVSLPQAVNLTRKEADIFLSFFKPSVGGLASEEVGSFSLFLYCSQRYIESHGLPLRRSDLADHQFVAYIEDLLAIDAVRWLDEAVLSPKVKFYSNSIIAQCSAALSGVGIAMLPTFIAAGVPGLVRILETEVTVKRTVWVSIRTEASYLNSIKSVLAFLKYIFSTDEPFLSGRTSELERAERLLTREGPRRSFRPR